MDKFEKYGKKLGENNKEFTRLISVLTGVDDKVRELALSDNDGGTLKSLLKVAKSKFNRREYVETVIYLGMFHDKLFKIKEEFGKLQTDLTKAHAEFLFGSGLDPAQKKFLMERMPEKFKPKPKETPKKAAFNAELIKEAGPSDWWYNWTSERGADNRMYEKQFPKYTKQIKKDTEKMLNKSEVLLTNLYATLKALVPLRNNRSLEKYVELVNAFGVKYDYYNDEFTSYYNEHISKLIETQAGIDSDAAKRLGEAAEAAGEAGAKVLISPEAQTKITKSLDVPSPPSTPATMAVEPFDLEVPEVPSKNYFPAAKPISTIPNDRGTTQSAPSAGTPAPFPHPSKVRSGPPSLDSDPVTRDFSTRRVPYSNVDTDRDPRSRVDTDSEPVFNLYQRTEMAPALPFQPTQAPSQGPQTMRSAPGLDLLNPSIPKHRLPSQQLLNLVEQQTTPDTDVTPPTLRGVGPIDSGPSDTEKSPSTMRSRSSEQFIAELSASTNESPFSLANRIVKFANSISKTDKVASDKLLVIARNILSRI